MPPKKRAAAERPPSPPLFTDVLPRELREKVASALLDANQAGVLPQAIAYAKRIRDDIQAGGVVGAPGITVIPGPGGRQYVTRKHAPFPGDPAEQTVVVPFDPPRFRRIAKDDMYMRLGPIAAERQELAPVINRIKRGRRQPR